MWAHLTYERDVHSPSGLGNRQSDNRQSKIKRATTCSSGFVWTYKRFHRAKIKSGLAIKSLARSKNELRQLAPVAAFTAIV